MQIFHGDRIHTAEPGASGFFMKALPAEPDRVRMDSNGNELTEEIMTFSVNKSNIVSHNAVW